MVCDSGPRQKPRNPETPKPRNPETLLKKTPIIRLESLISICVAFMGVEIADALFR
jgi:hypothetical protein